MAFRSLIVKEWRTLIPPFAVFAAAVVLLHVFVRYRGLNWEEEVVMVVSFMLPFIFVGCLTAGLGYYQLHTEWKTNAIYLLMSFPIRGWKVLTAKLAAVLSLFLLSLLWIGASFVLILLTAIGGDFISSLEPFEGMAIFFNFLVNGLWMYGLVMLCILSVLQFAFMCGQLVARLRWLVVLAACFIAVWVMLRLTPVLSALLTWSPDILFGGGDDAAYLHSGPFLVLLLISIGIVWLSGYLYEREVEV